MNQLRIRRAKWNRPRRRCQASTAYPAAAQARFDRTRPENGRERKGPDASKLLASEQL